MGTESLFALGRMHRDDDIHYVKHDDDDFADTSEKDLLALMALAKDLQDVLGGTMV